MSDAPVSNPAGAPAAPAPAPQTVRVGDACRLAGDLQVSMSTAERLARKGPYPYYTENCAVVGIDDYAIEAGGTVMVPSFGQVLGASGRLLASYEPGRCTASEHVHALVPHDPTDGVYLWRVLTNSPRAARMVTGTSQLRQIAAAALLSVPIPWPCRSTRDAFVDGLDDYDRRSRELADLVPALLAEGDEAFARDVLPTCAERVAAGEAAQWHAGTNVLAKDRAPGKPARVEGPQGGLGNCDEVLVDGRAVMVGPSGRHMLAHVTQGPCHPIAEMRYAAQEDSCVPLGVLLFALRAAGVRDRLRAFGHQVDAPALSRDDFAALPLALGTPEARAAFAPVADDLIARVLKAQADAAALVQERAEFVATFIRTATVNGMGSCTGCESAVGDLPEPRGASLNAERAKTAARAAIEAREEAAKPGLALSGQQRVDLGPLAALVEADAFGLGAADVAWELAPLAVVRACAAPGDWEAVAAQAAQAFGPDFAGLVPALDAAMGRMAEEDDLLSFVPNLSYASSLLAPAQLAAWVRALDAIEAHALTGGNVRAAFMLEPGTACLPASAARVLDEVLRAAATRMPAGFETAYVPCEAREGVMDALARTLPGVTMRAQFDEFSNMLAAAMVRAVELRGARETRGGLGAAAGSSLVADEFADWAAPLVVASLPPNAGEWRATPVPADDARWFLGTPPRARANFAWLQHAVSHQEPGGLTVLLVCNALLESTSGCEPQLRRRLVESGRVRLVAALPGGIFADGRPATSLLVLGDARAVGEGVGLDAAPCLMVSALGLAQPNPDAPAGLFADGVAPDGVARRVLPDEAADRVARACAAWVARGEAADEPGFARAVGAAEILAHDALLVPWAYLGE